MSGRWSGRVWAHKPLHHPVTENPLCVPKISRSQRAAGANALRDSDAQAQWKVGGLRLARRRVDGRRSLNRPTRSSCDRLAVLAYSLPGHPVGHQVIYRADAARRRFM